MQKLSIVHYKQPGLHSKTQFLSESEQVAHLFESHLLQRLLAVSK